MLSVCLSLALLSTSSTLPTASSLGASISAAPSGPLTHALRTPLEERRRAMKDELAPFSAAFEAAMASGNPDQIVRALQGFTPFNNDDVVVMCARALRYTASPEEADRIAKEQVEVKEPELRELPRFNEMTDEEFDRLLDSKRAEVLELRRYELAATVAGAAAFHLGEITSKKSLKAMVDALDDPAIAINPYAQRKVVDALMMNDESSKQIEDALCDLIATFPDLDRSRLASDEHPQLPRTTPYTQPLIGAAAYFARRGTERKVVVAALVEGLMYGADEEDKNSNSIDLGDGIVVSFSFNLDDIDDSSIKAVARECSRALQVVTHERYAPCHAGAYKQAKEWLDEKAKKAGIK